MNFVVCVSASKVVPLPQFILHIDWSNMDFLKGCNIEGANITTEPKGFINST